MARRMSCSLTIDAVRARTKTVTRRALGTWRNLSAGNELVLVEKAMGLPRGASQVVLCTVDVVDVRDEHLSELLVEPGGIAAEGFDPEVWTPAAWIAWWKEEHGYLPDVDPDFLFVRRIEWRYRPEP